ncbi:MAG: hypothetical protein WC980_06195 [Candidatus Brocadiia bacterium]
MSKKAIGLVIVVILLIASLGYLLFGSIFLRQIINMNIAEKHLPVIKSALETNQSFRDIRLKVGKKFSGCISVIGTVPFRQDINELKDVIHNTRPPVAIDYIVFSNDNTDWTDLSDGLKCLVALEKNLFALNEDIQINVFIRNSTDKVITFGGRYYGDNEPAFRSGIDPMLKDSNNIEIKSIVNLRFIDSSAGREIKPGESDYFSFDLTDCYRIDRLGDYSFHLAFTKKHSGFADGQSNIIEFEIVDKTRVVKIDYLGNHDMAWGTDASPIMAESSSGKIYAIWRGMTKNRANSADIMSVIPRSLLLNQSNSGKDWTSIPGINVCDSGQWSAPQLLVAGDEECDPFFAWCQGEDLNLLVEMSDDLWHHLFYNSASKTWSHLSIMNDPPDSAGPHSDFKIHDGKVHVSAVTNNSIRYECYDGKNWGNSILLQLGVVLPRSRMAITEKGDVHIIGKGFKEGGMTHWVISGGKIIKSIICSPEKPILDDCFDIVVDGQDTPLLVYQADLPENHPDRNKLHLSKWNGTEWLPPVCFGYGKERLLGAIRLAKYGRKVIMLWNHNREITYNVGQNEMCWSGPMTSFKVLSNDGIWSFPQPVGQKKPPPKIPVWLWDEGDFIDSPGAAIYVDTKGLVHMAWQENTEIYHAIVTDLSR